MRLQKSSPTKLDFFIRDRHPMYWDDVIEKIARRCKVSKQVVTNWRLGTTTVPPLARPLIAEILDCKLEDIWPQTMIELDNQDVELKS